VRACCIDDHRCELAAVFAELPAAAGVERSFGSEDKDLAGLGQDAVREGRNARNARPRGRAITDRVLRNGR